MSVVNPSSLGMNYSDTKHLTNAWKLVIGSRCYSGHLFGYGGNLRSLVQSLSRVLILWDPMDCSTLGFPIHRQLTELAQTHVYRVGDAIQPSHPLSSPSPPAFFLSSRVFESALHIKVLELQLQHQSFQVQHQFQIRLQWGGGCHERLQMVTGL